MTEHEELEMWKKMYLRAVRGMEDAIQALTQAERGGIALHRIRPAPRAAGKAAVGKNLLTLP